MAYKQAIVHRVCPCGIRKALFRVFHKSNVEGDFCEVCADVKVKELNLQVENEGPGWA